MRSIVWAAGLVAAAATVGSAQVRITEFMYSGVDGEFIEFTNLGDTAIDMTGWSFDDDSALPGVFDLSGFSVIGAGESVILTEIGADLFRAAWGLDAGVRIIGEYTNNLGRNDQINLFDASGVLVDRLTFGDQNLPGSIRTQNVSGNPLAHSLGADDVFGWLLSEEGDAFGSYYSLNGDLANPGRFVPTPGAGAVLVLGVGAGLRRRR